MHSDPVATTWLHGSTWREINPSFPLMWYHPLMVDNLHLYTILEWRRQSRKKKMKKEEEATPKKQQCDTSNLCRTVNIWTILAQPTAEDHPSSSQLHLTFSASTTCNIMDINMKFSHQFDNSGHSSMFHWTFPTNWTFTHLSGIYTNNWTVIWITKGKITYL